MVVWQGPVSHQTDIVQGLVHTQRIQFLAFNANNYIGCYKYTPTNPFNRQELSIQVLTPEQYSIVPKPPKYHIQVNWERDSDSYLWEIEKSVLLLSYALVIEFWSYPLSRLAWDFNVWSAPQRLRSLDWEKRENSSSTSGIAWEDWKRPSPLGHLNGDVGFIWKPNSGKQIVMSFVLFCLWFVFPFSFLSSLAWLSSKSFCVASKLIPQS
jgi:hypothetical protein